MKTETTYSTKQVADLADVTYRQVDHWCRSGVLGEDLAKPIGSGYQRTFNEEDLYAVIACGRVSKAITKMSDQCTAGSLSWFKQVAQDVRNGRTHSCMTIGFVYISVSLPTKKDLDVSTT